MNLNPEKQLLIKLADTILCFQQSDLLFVKAGRSYSSLTFIDQKTIRISKPMSWVIDLVENGFLVKSHKSFAVNRSKIESIDPANRKINLTNGIVVPISSRSLPKVLKIIKN